MQNSIHQKGTIYHYQTAEIGNVGFKKGSPIVKSQGELNQVRQKVRKGKYEPVYSADVAQEVYENNRKRSVK